MNGKELNEAIARRWQAINARRASMHPIVRQPMPFQPYYESGGITIYNADCKQVLPFLSRVDVLLTDPP